MSRSGKRGSRAEARVASQGREHRRRQAPCALGSQARRMASRLLRDRREGTIMNKKSIARGFGSMAFALLVSAGCTAEISAPDEPAPKKLKQLILQEPDYSIVEEADVDEAAAAAVP